MDEKRSDRRYVVEGMEGTLTFVADVEILNISATGLALRARRRIEIGREYRVKLQYGDRTVALNGVVVWSVLSGLGEGPHSEKIPIYEAGMKFTGVVSDKMTELLDFIGETKLAGDHRLDIRFNIKSPDESILNGFHNCRVKRASLNGMLLESDLHFELEERVPVEVFLSEDNKIRFVGRVAHCRNIGDEYPWRYNVGIEIVEMSEADKARLREFIETLSLTQ